jgi:hypothetical protein
MRRLEDVPLLFRAKEANFDCHSGLDSQLLYACGLEESRRWVSEHRSAFEGGDRLLNYLDTCDEPLEPWWKWMAERFPDLEPEWTSDEEIDLACDIGEVDIARAMLLEWEAAHSEPSLDHLQTLSWRWEAIGEHARSAATLERRLVLTPSPPWRDRVIEVAKIVDAWIRAQQPDAAWRAIREHLAPWQQDLNLWGRAVVAQRAVEIAQMLSSREVFAWSMHLLEGLRPKEDTVHRTAVERAMETAIALGDEVAVTYCRELLS